MIFSVVGLRFNVEIENIIKCILGGCHAFKCYLSHSYKYTTYQICV